MKKKQTFSIFIDSFSLHTLALYVIINIFVLNILKLKLTQIVHQSNVKDKGKTYEQKNKKSSAKSKNLTFLCALLQSIQLLS